MVGFLRHKTPWWQRILLVGGGLLMVTPEAVTDIIGIVIVAFVVMLQYFVNKKEKITAQKKIPPVNRWNFFVDLYVVFDIIFIRNTIQENKYGHKQNLR